VIQKSDGEEEGEGKVVNHADAFVKRKLSLSKLLFMFQNINE
jgi:hypothetical protein